MSEYNEMEFRAKLLANQKDKLIAEFQKFLRVLHDHTFNPLDAQENLNWIRFEIERKLKETKTKDQNLIKRTHIIEVDD